MSFFLIFWIQIQIASWIDIALLPYLNKRKQISYTDFLRGIIVPYNLSKNLDGVLGVLVIVKERKGKPPSEEDMFIASSTM